MSNKSTANIEMRADGLYLVINNVDGEEKITRKQILDLVESYNVKDLNFDTIQEIFQSTEMYIERKISENNNVITKNEEVKVEIARDRLTAYITFSPPTGGGHAAEENDIFEAVSKANVKFGVDNLKIKELAAERVFGVSYGVAYAKPPVDGKDGHLEFGFDASGKRDNAPKVLENGNIDFKNLNLIEMVQKGQRLIKIVIPEEGEDGIDVIGNPIPYKRGKPAPNVAKGQNVFVDEEASEMIAEANGQVLYVNKKLSVNPILEIPGDVGPSTGNVEFNGSVTVRGNVLSGYSISADANVDVYGAVEASKITAGFNVFLFSGVQGGGKAEITAGGDITTKFAEGCTLKAGRNIVANSVMHSDINCGGVLELDGKNGNLVGGKISVGELIKAKTIGSGMATATDIIVGNNPDNIEKYNELAAEYEHKSGEYAKIDNLVQKLIEEHNAGKTNSERKNLLLKSLRVKAQFRDDLIVLEKELAEMKQSLVAHRGRIYAYTMIRSGVKVTIGNATLFIRDDIRNALLKNEDSKIVVHSAV